MEEKKYNKDETIIKQGDEVQEVFVVESGALTFTQQIVDSK